MFFFVSGGVDSTVAFALCARVLPHDRVLGVYVDTGLMREGETAELLANLGELGVAGRIRVRDERGRFLEALRAKTKPEEKREIIGRKFVEVQAAAMQEYGIDSEKWMLGQGTIYPDTIESGGASSSAAVIKTHHNRCEEIRLLMEVGKVIEPLAEFYKDEVREIGAELGLSKALTNRWPFPGPGLAIRCLGTEGEEKPAVSVTLDDPTYEGVRLPLSTVGVQGDKRTYRQVVAVEGPLDYERLQKLSSDLCNLSREQNRVIVVIRSRGKLQDARVRVRGMNDDRIEMLRQADSIARRVMERHGLMDSVWQFPVVLIPVSFGEGESIVLRPVNSVDGMTASFGCLDQAVVEEIAQETMASIPGIDAVLLDATNKPPATIEWE